MELSMHYGKVKDLAKSVSTNVRFSLELESELV